MISKVGKQVLILILAATTVLMTTGIIAADANLPVQLYTQTNTNWATDTMGHTTYTLQKYGCLTTSLAMVFDCSFNIDPKEMNIWLTNQGLYNKNAEITGVSKAANINPGAITYISRLDGANLDRVKKELDGGYPVIAKIKYGKGYHFFVITGYSGSTFYINDPLKDTRQVLNDRYGDPSKVITQIIIFHGTPIGTNLLDKPTGLTQYKSDGVTGITVGDTITENTVVMKGGVSDPSGNMVKLDVEVKPVEIPFTYTPTISSGPLTSGSTASVTVTGLANGQYKWQARATNSQGASGPWQAAGGNADTSPDFIVSVAAPPDLPTALTQYQSDGVTGITVGNITTESTVVMKGGVSDPSGNMVKLDVEVRPVETAFTNTPTSSSELVSSESTASVTVSGLANGQYKWQARATNSQGISGSWQAAGGNADTSPDFIVSVAAPVTLSIDPSSGPQGTTFTFSGTGYTPNGAIAWRVSRPDNSRSASSLTTASSSGALSYTYRSTASSTFGSLVGNYTIWTIDSTTRRESNSVQVTIT